MSIILCSQHVHVRNVRDLLGYSQLDHFLVYIYIYIYIYKIIEDCMNIFFCLKPSLHQITATMNILIVNILKEEKKGIKFQEKMYLYTCLELNIIQYIST